MGQNILVNESVFFMPFILFFVRIVDIFHSITNEWAKFDTKDMFFIYFFSHASPTSTTYTNDHSAAAAAPAAAAADVAVAAAAATNVAAAVVPGHGDLDIYCWLYYIGG
jgi:hypothetical protein